jgi:hypothetical protein
MIPGKSYSTSLLRVGRRGGAFLPGPGQSRRLKVMPASAALAWTSDARTSTDRAAAMRRRRVTVCLLPWDRLIRRLLLRRGTGRGSPARVSRARGAAIFPPSPRRTAERGCLCPGPGFRHPFGPRFRPRSRPTVAAAMRRGVRLSLTLGDRGPSPATNRLLGVACTSLAAVRERS